jgi:hypothetical protein
VGLDEESILHMGLQKGGGKVSVVRDIISAVGDKIVCR